ncbi:aldo/keto reductase [Brachybacterium sp. GCM10030267]|uniref:aldo/keto reductase n=1 Tax=unclassified Brachybacterium TaxID=2623841 RepID=UPI0036231F25
MRQEPEAVQPTPGGTTNLGDHPVARIGYGAMQLAHADEATAHAILRRAAELGVNHIDTASFYGNGRVNRLIRSALAPYPSDLALVSKVGARFDAGHTPTTVPAQRPHELRSGVEDDLRELGTERITVVNLRRMDAGPGFVDEGGGGVPLDDQLAELVALRDEGKIGAIGLSNVSAAQLQAALTAGIVCVQNLYSVLDRRDEALLEMCRRHDIAWVPFAPLGSALDHIPSPTEHPVVKEIAARIGVTSAQVSLAWVLAHAPNTLLIPGTGSIEHLTENIAAADVRLSAADMSALDALTSNATARIR